MVFVAVPPSKHRRPPATEPRNSSSSLLADFCRKKEETSPIKPCSGCVSARRFSSISAIFQPVLGISGEFSGDAMMRDQDAAVQARTKVLIIFTEATVVGEDGKGEEMKPPERYFYAKYWMHLIPLGLISMNVMTQAMNMPEEQANGQPSSKQEISGHGQATTVR